MGKNRATFVERIEPAMIRVAQRLIFENMEIFTHILFRQATTRIYDTYYSVRSTVFYPSGAFHGQFWSSIKQFRKDEHDLHGL